MAERRETILEARRVTKRFPGVLALDEVSFQLAPGEAHALVGENGAGKSTLIKALTGAYKPDGGQVLLGGKEVSFASPRDSQSAGISTIYQEVNLIPLRSVAQNVFLGREPRNRFGLLDVRRMEREAAGVLERYGVRVDVSAPLRTLGLGTQQMVAIARAVSMEAKVVIMDEPTSSLEASEVETLFRVIRQLKSEGVGVIYVSHRMDEIYEVCERVTVLRDGRVARAGSVSELPRLQLIASMLGRELSSVEEGATSFEAGREAKGESVLRVEALTRRHLLDGVSLEVHAGEVVGLGGLLGAGRSETARAIFGVQPLDSGDVKVSGKRVRTGAPAAAIKAGIAFLPEDRRAEGIIPHLSVRENIVSAALPRLSRLGFVSEREQDRIAREFIERLGIRTSGPGQRVGELSGGNQQKVLLARWLCMNPKVLILDDPTRGIDVGAKAEVQGLIDELADEGLGVLLISSELEEVVEGSDRMVLLKEGTVVGSLSGENVSGERVMEILAEDASDASDASEASGDSDTSNVSKTSEESGE